MAEHCAAIGWPVARKGSSGRTDVLTGWWSLVQVRSRNLNRNFTLKGRASVMSLPLGPFRVGSWPHKAKLDTEATGWALPVMAEATQWWQQLLTITAAARELLLDPPGQCGEHDGQKLPWKIPVKPRGIMMLQTLTFQLLPSAGWATGNTYGNFPSFKKS